MARERHQPALEERAKSSTESRRRGMARTDPAREGTAGQQPTRPDPRCSGCGGKVIVIGRWLKRPGTDNGEGGQLTVCASRLENRPVAGSCRRVVTGQ